MPNMEIFLYLLKFSIKNKKLSEHFLSNTAISYLFTEKKKINNYKTACKQIKMCFEFSKVNIEIKTNRFKLCFSDNNHIKPEHCKDFCSYGSVAAFN